jgi:hypothetical protein
MKKKISTINFILFAGVCTIFVSHALYYLPLTSDDAFISLRYAKRLACGLGLTWTDGEKVEGYTNLLWVLLNAVLGNLLSDYMLSARIWGTIGGLLAVIFVSLHPQDFPRIEKSRLMTGGIFLALSSPMAAWAVGGLEHSFMSGATAAALFFLMSALDKESPDTRTLLLSGLLFGIVAITRADGVLFSAAAISGILLSNGLHKSTIKTMAIVSIFPVFLYGAQLLFRILYYGEFVPNTALAKIAINSGRVMSGLYYARNVFAVHAILLGAGFMGLILAIGKSRSHRWVIPFVSFTLWVAYIIVVGGDIFHAWRQMLPSFVPLAFLISEGVTVRKSVFKNHIVVTTIGLSFLLGSYLFCQLADERTNIIRRMFFYETATEYVGKLLKTSFGKYKPLLAVDAAGSLPFWSELPALDMLGLNDKYLATHPPKTFGTRGIGHELGNGKYVLRRSPDIVVVNSGLGNTDFFWPSAKEMYATDEFKKDYQMTRAAATADDGNLVIITMYIKRANPQIGIKRTPNEIRIPGYLFSASVAEPARLGFNNKLFLPLNNQSTARIADIHVDRGTWQLSTNHPTPSDGHHMECSGGIINHSHYRPNAPFALKVNAPTDLSISINVPSWLIDILSLYDVFLRRVPDSEATFICTPDATPIAVDLSDLSNKKADQTQWNDPGNIIFKEAGISVILPVLDRPKTMSVSFDSNDQYRIEYYFQNRLLGSSIIGPRNDVGLVEYSVDIPHEVTLNRIDRLGIQPLSGDKLYSIGHLLFEN